MSRAVVALAGNPNTGKTSLFNALTGSRQKVGNWPGVTVERKEGRLSLDAGEVTLVDLPGVYSLGASSVDEQIAADFLRNERPGAVVTVVDATNVERSLYLATQLRESGVPVIVALNMWDLAEKKGISMDIARLEALLGVDVVPTTATKGTGLDELRRKIASRLAAGHAAPRREDKPLALLYGDEVERSLAAIAKALPGDMTDHERRLLSIRTAEGDSGAVSGLPGAEAILAIAVSENGRIEKALEYDLQTAVILKRWDFISSVTGQVLRRDPAKSSGTTWDERLDRIVTNRFLGLPLFLLVAWGVFQSVFAIGDTISDHLDGLLGADVVPTAATNGTGLDELRRKIASRLAAARRDAKPLALPYGDELERSLATIAKALPGSMSDHERRLLSIRTAEGIPGPCRAFPGPKRFSPSRPRRTSASKGRSNTTSRRP